MNGALIDIGFPAGFPPAAEPTANAAAANAKCFSGDDRDEVGRVVN